MNKYSDLSMSNTATLLYNYLGIQNWNQSPTSPERQSLAIVLRGHVFYYKNCCTCYNLLLLYIMSRRVIICSAAAWSTLLQNSVPCQQPAGLLGCSFQSFLAHESSSILCAPPMSNSSECRKIYIHRMSFLNFKSWRYNRSAV